MYMVGNMIGKCIHSLFIKQNKKKPYTKISTCQGIIRNERILLNLIWFRLYYFYATVHWSNQFYTLNTKNQYIYNKHFYF